jgi:hypothetical protein
MVHAVIIGVHITANQTPILRGDPDIFENDKEIK